ncbi:MAG TPA: hypothetical protein VKI65_10950 [Gemmataceae bacterium]|nr:hypothetical protein [Gemmataceae bacterium]
MFSKSEFKDLFREYNLVQLYTDVVPNELYPPEIRAKLGGDTVRQKADAGVNRWFQTAAFGTEQLPLYVILEPLPNGKIDIVGKYDEGKINDEGAFAQFLKKPLAGDGNGARAESGIGR